MENNSMQHAGIKGMRWGVRRYQNPDGSLTPAGKKRYRNAVTKFTNSKIGSKYKLSDNDDEERRLVEGNPPLSKREKRLKNMSEDARTASTLKKKSVGEMSNAELKKLNERVRLEQEYSRLNPNTVQKGWKYVAAAAGVTGTALAVYNNSNQLISIGKKFVGR